MTRIEPDGLVPKWRNHLAPNPGMALVEEPAFVLSTVLRAIASELARYDTEGDFGDAEEEAYCHGAVQALTNLRARFQPTEGENGHE